MTTILSFSLLHTEVKAEEAIRFENVYHKAFYKSQFFVTTAIAAVAAGGVAFSTMTAGTGAPAAATGVSSIASWIGGGGAGSYMAGLSTVGGMVGGNAITGAAILNGASAALIGGATTKGAASLIFACEGAIEAYYLLSENDKKIDYSIDIPIPQDYGSEQLELPISSLTELANNQNTELKSYESVVELLDNIPHDSLTKQDQVLHAILYYKLGHQDKFTHYIDRIEYNFDDSFIIYLKAVAALVRNNLPEAKLYAGQAMSEEPEAIEPILLCAIISEETNSFVPDRFNKRLNKFDDGHYETPNSLLTAFNLLGDIALHNGDVSYAKKFFTLADGELGTFSTDDDRVEAMINLKLSRCYALLNDRVNSRKHFKDALRYALDSESPDIATQAEYLYFTHWFNAN